MNQPSSVLWAIYALNQDFISSAITAPNQTKVLFLTYEPRTNRVDLYSHNREVFSFNKWILKYFILFLLVIILVESYIYMYNFENVEIYLERDMDYIYKKVTHFLDETSLFLNLLKYNLFICLFQIEILPVDFDSAKVLNQYLYLFDSVLYLCLELKKFF